MSVTYTSVLPVRDDTVEFLAGLLAAERLRRGTREPTRSLSCTTRRYWSFGGSWTAPE